MRVTLIHNPTAGGGARSDAETLVNAIESAGHKTRYQSTKEKGWRKSLKKSTDLVAVAGGDGTVAKVGRVLAGTETPMTILPGGTANNLALTLGLAESTVPDLIAGWARASRRPFDLGIAIGPWGEEIFLESFGAGLFAWTMATSDEQDKQKTRHSRNLDDVLAEARTFLHERLHGFDPRRLTIAIDGRDCAGEFLLMEAMNIKSIGPNLRLAPQADTGDGLLDLVLVAADERDRLRKHLRANHDSVHALPVQRAKHLRIEGRQLEFHIDDRPWQDGDDESALVIDIRVQPQALHFLIPEPSKA